MTLRSYWPSGDRWKAVDSPCTVSCMNGRTDTLVLGPARQLDDLLELARLTADRLLDDGEGPLARELKAAAAAVRSEFIPDPMEG